MLGTGTLQAPQLQPDPAQPRRRVSRLMLLFASFASSRLLSVQWKFEQREGMGERKEHYFQIHLFIQQISIVFSGCFYINCL